MMVGKAASRPAWNRSENVFREGAKKWLPYSGRVSDDERRLGVDAATSHAPSQVSSVYERIHANG